MERQIKFRGKLQGFEGYVYGVPHNVYHNDINDNWFDSIQFMDETGKPQVEYIEPNTLSQFTGLKDKNEVEIYEGDIIEIKHPYKNRCYQGEIIYIDARFTGKDFYFTHHDNPSDIWESLEYVEIIGNIHTK